MTYTLEQLRDIPAPKTKEELFNRIAFTDQALETLLAAHDEAALTRPLGKSGWSAKDYLVHLKVWEDSIVNLFKGKNRMKELGLTDELIEGGDFDAQNDFLFNLHKDRPLSEVLQSLRDTHQELLDILAGLNDEDLQTPYRHYQPQAEGEFADNPIIGWIVGDTYDHYAEHIIYLNQLFAESE